MNRVAIAALNFHGPRGAPAARKSAASFQPSPKLANPMSGFSVNSQADLVNAILVCESAGAPGTAHLLRALRDGRIALLPLQPKESGSKLKDWIRLTKDRLAVLLIGDDDGSDHGPNSWAQARRTVTWARSVMLHAACAELFHYELALISAELTHRTLIIECSTTTLRGWSELVRSAPHRPNTLLITPPENEHHPETVRREGLH